MLNISDNSISNRITISEFDSYRLLKKTQTKKLFVFLAIALIIGIIFSFFLPWTQNISAKGYVTTRMPEQRPQSVPSIIAGRIENWYIKEGDYVNKGDTLAFISEVKSEYLNPDLIARTSEQADAKTMSASSYAQKIQALDNQFAALEKGLILKKQQIENKILQVRNKISVDSLELTNYETNYIIAENQFNRTKSLYDKGLKTLSQLQEKELKLQNMTNKITVQKNKLDIQRNELSNTKISISSVEQEYADKMAKIRSEQQSALSAKYDALANASKLKNKISNYSAREKMYYITAPQSGYIMKILKKGIGENIKEGANIATIMPAKYELAIEIYLKPQDLPLVDIGHDVTLRLDGWPAVIISGWPESSTGMFPGKIVWIDRVIGENGFYRVLVSQTKGQKKWPEELRIGTGSKIFILLKDVPVWYEVWRQLNGFPPDFYQDDGQKSTPIKRKAPIKSIK